MSASPEGFQRRISIDLTDSPFNVNAFDGMIAWLHDDQKPTALTNPSISHFVVVDDVMRILVERHSPVTLDLKAFTQQFPNIWLVDMQAAGALFIDRGLDQVTRKILTPINWKYVGQYSRKRSLEYFQGRFTRLIGQTNDNRIFQILS